MSVEKRDTQPVYRVGNKFYQELTVPCYDTDSSFVLKPSAFMDMAQEIAYWAADGMGFGYDDLMDHGTAWVLSRMHFKMVSPPRWRDPVTLVTWHKGADGLFFLRDFCLQDPSGKALVLCTSSWIVMDVNTRRLKRSDEIIEMVPASSAGEGDAIAAPAPRLAPPKGMSLTEAGSRTVSYSDIDILGHTNNVRYLVWGMDCIDYDYLMKHPVREVKINFNRETRPGDKVGLSVAALPPEEGGFYVEGFKEGSSVFNMKLLLMS